jgi:hypothetical protein
LTNPQKIAMGISRPGAVSATPLSGSLNRPIINHRLITYHPIINHQSIANLQSSIAQWLLTLNGC